MKQNKLSEMKVSDQKREQNQSPKQTKSLSQNKRTDEVNVQKGSSSPLLERYLQKTMTDQMQQVDDQLLASAIQTLLYEGKQKNKRLN